MSAKKISPQRAPARPATAEDLTWAVDSLLGLMRRAVAGSDGELPFEGLVDFTEKYSRVCTRLVTLVKAQRELAQELGVASALNQALTELMDEMKAK